MSGPCTDCGGPDYQTLEARIAEMEAELADTEKRFAAIVVANAKLLDRIAALEAANLKLDEMVSGHKERIHHELEARDRFHRQRDIAVRWYVRHKTGIPFPHEDEISKALDQIRACAEERSTP